jgi:hypothetical protein
LITPIVFLAGLAALPATDRSARLEVEASAFFGVRHFDQLAYSFFGLVSGYELRGGGSAGLTIFAARVVDDDAAPSLQPFLQRVFRFHIGLGGDGRAVSWTAIKQYNSDYRDASFNASAEGYVGPWIHLAAGVSLAYSEYQQALSSEIVLQPWAEFGVRIRDNLMSVGWTVLPYRIDQKTPPNVVAGQPVYEPGFRADFFGNAYFDFHGVIKRWVDLGTDITVIHHGALAHVDATFWLRRRLGLSFGVSGGRGAYLDERQFGDPYGNAGDYSQAGTSFGVRIWERSSFSIFAGYSFRWHSSVTPSIENDGYLHTLTVSLSLRPH